MSGIGIALMITNSKPSIEVRAGRLEQRQGTVIGLVPVSGGKGPGLSLRASF